ncbi:MAG TPA: SDR family oxidoreductase [Acidimicrobiales bacterium]|nr:SDR family oxidoreductase [Acidimicrobiales bacterium]
MSGPVGLEVSPEGMLLTDRVAVVTGAAQGIGEACALGLARFGAHVAVCDREPDGLAATVADVEALGRRTVSGELDVRDAEAVDAFLAEVEAEFGHVDVLVNNAGGTFFSPFLDVSARGEAALIAENFTQVTHFIRSTVPLMGDRGGSIVNVTSIEGHRAGPGFAVYSAMKAAVENLTRSLALELAERRIRVNCIAPDMIPTPGDAGLSEEAAAAAAAEVEWSKTILPDLGHPDDCAAAVVYLASDFSRFVTGSTIHPDAGNLASGGWKRLPNGRYVL